MLVTATKSTESRASLLLDDGVGGISSDNGGVLSDLGVRLSYIGMLCISSELADFWLDIFGQCLASRPESAEPLQTVRMTTNRRRK
jgi:hypothetical protein